MCFTSANMRYRADVVIVARALHNVIEMCTVLNDRVSSASVHGRPVSSTDTKDIHHAYQTHDIQRQRECNDCTRDNEDGSGRSFRA